MNGPRPHRVALPGPRERGAVSDETVLTRCPRCDAAGAYLRDALQAIADALDVPLETSIGGAKANGVLLDDILVALGRPLGEGARL